MSAWDKLPAFSKELYKATYFKEGDDFESWSHRIAHKYANDYEHGERVKAYIHKKWFHPSTPISSDRGLPIACYVSHVGDSNESIFDSYYEGMWLGALGGGRGVYWGDVGAQGRPIGKYNKQYSWQQIQDDDNIPKSPGVVPFLGVSDRATYAISQAGTRRSTECAYIPIYHADIVAFKDIRLETGSRDRRMPNLHHGIAITDDFMNAVKRLDTWDLIEPHTGLVVETVDAYDLWMDILLIRKTETGEPFLLFIDTVNKDNPIEYTKEGYLVYSSNICTEIVGATSPDMTAVCCLASLNLEQWDEYAHHIDTVIKDISDYLTNVLLYTLEQAKDKPGFERVCKFIEETMEIGIGVMGLASLYQKKFIPFESPMAKALNSQIMATIKQASDKVQEEISASERCLLSKKHGTHKRNLHSIAIAPTMSISTLSGLCSSGVEPWVANIFTKKVPTGSYVIKNKYLEQVIYEEMMKRFEGQDSQLGFDWVKEQWQSINKHQGSVQHLEWMNDYTKDVFKTAYEIDQRTIIGLAADRQVIMKNEQSQSINLFMGAEITYEELYAIHMMAWEQGLKSLYYLRSQPAVNADVASKDRKPITLEDDVCVACT
jgi:ribonucleoside-diphosphate reductase alpha chain